MKSIEIRNTWCSYYVPTREHCTLVADPSYKPSVFVLRIHETIRDLMLAGF